MFVAYCASQIEVFSLLYKVDSTQYLSDTLFEYTGAAKRCCQVTIRTSTVQNIYCSVAQLHEKQFLNDVIVTVL